MSATPGVIQYLVTFNAPFVPDTPAVDARDSANAYTAQATAAQNGPACIAASQNWCYSMVVVESALASGYYLRPIAYAAKSSPVFVANRAPFPPTGLVAITPGATVTPEHQLSTRRDLGRIQRERRGTPSRCRSVPCMLSVNDLSNTFAEPCIGSIDFCPYNSVFQSSAAAYQLYLKPTDTYNYLTQAVGFQEAGGAKTTIQFNGNQPAGATPAAGVDVTKNYSLNQAASVAGGLSVPGQSIYGYSVGVIGSSTTSRF